MEATTRTGALSNTNLRKGQNLFFICFMFNLQMKRIKKRRNKESRPFSVM